MYSVELNKNPETKVYCVAIKYLGVIVSEVVCPIETASAILEASSRLTEVYNDNHIKPFGFPD